MKEIKFRTYSKVANSMLIQTIDRKKYDLMMKGIKLLYLYLGLQEKNLLYEWMEMNTFCLPSTDIKKSELLGMEIIYVARESHLDISGV